VINMQLPLAGDISYIANNPNDYKAEVNTLALHEDTQDLNGWTPTTDAVILSANNDKTGYALSSSLYVFNQVDTIALSKCDVKVMNSSGTTTEALRYTSPEGLTVVGLMNGNYRVLPSRGTISLARPIACWSMALQ